ncbi:MAG: hypothetical protein SGJ18_02660 [Pseudomonadota bacterium]|nr:hypothetical protein [Pseudomonadota bacterium]
MPFYSEWFKRLSDFEVSPNLLWIAGISFLVAFLFLIREFFSWMVKQGELKRDLKDIKAELESISELLRDYERNKGAESNTPQPAFPLVSNQNHDQSLEN